MNDLVIKPGGQLGGASGVAGGAKSGGQGGGFSEVLRQSVESVNNSLQESEQAGVELVSGKNANIHETMIAMEKASISFRLLTKVQNKVISAYQEVMRMQV